MKRTITIEIVPENGTHVTTKDTEDALGIVSSAFDAGCVGGNGAVRTDVGFTFKVVDEREGDGPRCYVRHDLGPNAHAVCTKQRGHDGNHSSGGDNPNVGIEWPVEKP